MVSDKNVFLILKMGNKTASKVEPNEVEHNEYKVYWSSKVILMKQSEAFKIISCYSRQLDSKCVVPNEIQHLIVDFIVFSNLGFSCLILQ